MPSGGTPAEDPAQATEASHRGWSRLLFRTFRDPEIEALYRQYHDTARRTDVQYMLTCALACGAVGLGHEAPVGFRATHVAVIGVLTGVQFLLLAVTTLQWPGAACWRALPYLTWLLFVATIAVHVQLAHLSGPTEALEWYILLILLVYLCLPVRLRWCVVMSVLTGATYVTTNLVFASDRVHLRERVAASGVLLLGAVALGTTAYLFTDLRQRRTYLETRKVIEVKTSIEEQSRTRERLLLSVLPRHVADTMRQDWGRIDVGQFKKIYMKRHENVSILFADIVGFTAISSSYSAYDLVHMLNELFASFDRLADKYKQLRIKILGDCYYCISGCPEETEDHAVQSVYMGLSMVTAIKSVRESTKSTVDMRVGIHTGAVLAGVMGQRQWQFDVYSKDVELANKMESSGKPGRVHVSNKTVEKLADQFHIERAFGEKREPYLRGAGLTTYFIVKPKRSSSLGGKEGGTDAHQETDQRGSAAAGNGEGAAIISNGRDPEGGVYQSKVKPEQPQATHGSNSVRDLRPHVRWFTLFFTDPEIEKEYRANREPTFGLSAVCLPIVLSFNAISQGIITPSTIHTVTTLFGGVLLLLLMTLFILPSHWMRKMPGWLVSVSTVIQSSNTRTQTWVMGMNLLLTACNLADMIMCPLNSRQFMFPFTSSSAATANKTLSTSKATEPAKPLPCSASASAFPPHLSCTYPSYFTYFCVLILCTYPVQIELRHVTKLPMLLLATALHVWVNVTFLEDVLDCVSTNVYTYDGIFPEKYDLCLSLCVTCVVVMVLNVQTEVSSRAAFLWKREMAQQQAQAASLQEKNESLVQNLLPPHVTQHFLKRDVTTSQHEELYAQSFDEVGVLFASMPNFGDFYSEESVNNQGLECLRFLNEVISDYDALLDSPRFRGISKIKTIASSYMAASGLVTIQDKSEPDIVRWQHLSVLVEFAMQLRSTLSNINAESFNHFIFQMGINHGPVTAGVIGARKPHYDIWGNTVNVASRMESTGQAGQIQVTGKTKEILELFGYQFEQRGIMLIKGKGQLLTYFLTGRRSPPEDTRSESAHSGGARESAVVETTSGARTDLD